MRAPVALVLASCLCTACDPNATRHVAKTDSPAAAAEPASPPPSAAATPAPAPAPAASAPATPAPEPAPVPANLPRHFPGVELDEDAILRVLASAPLLSFRPVGTTSSVFKATLNGKLPTMAFKAATHAKPQGARAEIAAYRLARCLGVANVPPAISRRVPLAQLEAWLDTDDTPSWPAIQPTLVVESDHQVAGAAIYWVDGLRDLGLERSEGQAKAAAWLSLDHALEPADRNLAAQLSTLIAFDYLIGNWDRWSGGNLKSDASGEHVILRDHDAAFAARLGEPLHRRMLERLVQAQRFSRSFYRALRSLTRQTFTRELALDPAFGDKGPPLDPAALEALFDRRETLISHIAATIEERGETNVLAFP